MSEDVRRLPLRTLELWKRKAAAVDRALEYLAGHGDNEACHEVARILRAPSEAK
jgi:hypothetical protein